MILILILPLKSAISQVSYETSKALLIFQFAKNISHQKDEKIKKYKICFLGDDLKTYRELEKIIARNTIKGKPVELSNIKNINEIDKKHLLYVDKSLAKNIEEVWSKIENKNILLVTEQCADAKYIMLNILYSPEQEAVSFEINKANIIIENFSFNPELLLLGGKEVDIRGLYRDMKQLLEKEKLEVDRYKNELKKQTEELVVLRKQADSLHKSILTLEKEISVSENNLTYLSDSVKVQQNVFLEKLSQIKDQEIKLGNYKLEIRNKENEIEKGTLELINLINEKNKQQEIINKQKTTLSDQEEVISTKNTQLLFSSILAFMFVVLAISVYYALNTKKKANRKQLEVNRKLESQKLVLEKTLQELTDAQSQLIQSEKMASLGVLTAGIAHEINNPVNYISSGLEGLKTVSTQIVNIVLEYQQDINGNNQDENQEIDKQHIGDELKTLSGGIQSLTQNIQNGVQRTTEIIKSLNIFSRIDNDELSLTDLHENINSTITLLHNQYKNRIEIIKDYGQIPKTFCYSSKLNQVFMNVLSNAIHAIPKKGTIVIRTFHLEKSTGQKSGSIKISIKDSGTGIPKDIQTKIYEPFFTTKQVGQGTGLGLSITHSIIEQHNGSIEYTSDSEGTEFEIYIPVIGKKTN
ncbi:MAG: YfiR/HmsC family protein [Bacteroidota bacterium]